MTEERFKQYIRNYGRVMALYGIMLGFVLGIIFSHYFGPQR